MKKSELRNGMLVRIRKSDELWLVLIGSGSVDRIARDENFIRLRDYSETMADYDNKKWDIMVVYKPNTLALTSFFHDTRLTELWRREEEKKELTVAQIEELLGYDVKVVKGD